MVNNKPNQISSYTIHFNQVPSIKENALKWAFSFSTCCYLDSNNYGFDKYSTYECVIGIGKHDAVKATAGNAFEAFKNFKEKNADEFLLGYFSYDLKNEVEPILISNKKDQLGFDDLYFFVPEILILISKEKIEIRSKTFSTDFIFEKISSATVDEEIKATDSISLNFKTDKATYINDVKALQQCILNGTIYEINYCQEFFAEDVVINPLAVFEKINAKAQAPFSAFLKMENNYAMCVSPERFLKKQDSLLIAQPIKGTKRRSDDAAEDLKLKTELQHCKKEQAENVMIVDLMRNDLAKSAETGTVKVPELFGVYTFNTVHQLISTVTATAKKEMEEIEIIRNAFPMGSMTGTPKVAAMQLIDEIEKTKRGLFSGAIGYFDGCGNFDFNVVIRTLLYNADTKYLSLQTGGAITLDSDAEKEYEESLLKAKAWIEVLG